MLPRVIHYCWFGHAPLPELAKKCIASWRIFLPGYEIKRWDETNYDVNAIPYTREAYEAKKWAFVSDYARFEILYKYGGLYFDTDVELIRPMDDILQTGSFMGCQAVNVSGMEVAPGLGLGAEPGLALYEELLAFYRPLRFVNADGSYNTNTVVAYATEVLRRHGFDPCDEKIQKIGTITVYPPAYFSPINYFTGEKRITSQTRAIHHYTASWLTPLERRIVCVERKFSGGGTIRRGLGRACSLPLRIVNKIKREGAKNAIMLAIQKLRKTGGA